MPFEMAEDKAQLAKALAMAEDLRQDVAEKEDAKKNADALIMYIKQNIDLMERFGRFPGRNGALGRETTEEEKKWTEESATPSA